MSGPSLGSSQCVGIVELLCPTAMTLTRFPQLRTLTRSGPAKKFAARSLSSAARPRAEEISANWKGTSATGGATKNFIGGEFVDSKTTEWIDIHDPVSILSFLLFWSSLALSSRPKRYFPVFPRAHRQSSRQLLTRRRRRLRPGVAPACSPDRNSFSSGSIISARKVEVDPVRLQQLLRQNADAIANSIVLEQGKTLAGMTSRSVPFVS